MGAAIFQMNARDLLNKSKNEIWELPQGWYDITFDNGEVFRSTSRRCIYTWYCWIFHRMFPETPLLPRHHFLMAQTDRSVHRRILGNSLTDMRRVTNMKDKAKLEKMWALIYECTNDIFNDFSENLEEYVTSTSAEDVADLLHYPPIKAINDAIQAMNFPDERMVTTATKSIEAIMRGDLNIAGHPMVRTLKCGSARAGQMLQIGGPIGHRTDVDGKIYEPAIARGYGHGMKTLRDTLIESRDACRNIFFQNRPMQLSEWNNRVVQLMTAILANLHEGDCGTTDLLSIFVEDNSVLKDIRGSYFHDEEIGMLRPIEPDDKQLIGKHVKIRNVIGCRHADRYGFCSTCYGELYYNVPDRTNIGHVAPTEVLGPVGQLILSQKHFNGAATSIKFDLAEGSEEWLSVSEDGLHAMLTDIFKGRQFTVAFKAKEVKNILDLDQVEEEDLDGGNLSSLSTIYITFYNGVGLETVSIPLSRARQQPVFSLKFIRYIRAFGWYINEQGQYEVDMRDWDIADPVLEMPLAQFSAPMYMTLIQEFIRGSTVKGDKTDNDSVLKYDYLGDALIAFRNIVALKLSINITQLAIILQATKIASVQDNDYRPPAIKSEGVPRKFNDNMRFRDTVTAYAYQYHRRTIYDPANYLVTKRPPHYLEWFMRKNIDEADQI